MNNLIHGIVSQGGGGLFTEDWAESASVGAEWTSFVAAGSGGFTAESDGASVAIIPEDVISLDGDTAQFTFNIDTISAGSLTFSVDESGVDADDAVDNGVVTKVTGGTRSGAQAIFTSTGAKIVVIRTKKTNPAKKLRPKFKSTNSGQNIVISGFEAIGGQAEDFWTGAFFALEDDYSGQSGFNIVADDFAIVVTGSTNHSFSRADKKLGQSSFLSGGTNKLNVWPITSITYDQDDAFSISDWSTQLCTVEAVTFGGYDDVVKITMDATNSAHYAYIAMATANTQPIRFEVYIPTSNTGIDGFQLQDGGGTNLGDYNVLAAYDEWVQYSDRGANDNALRFVAKDGGVIPSSGVAGEVIYIRKLKVGLIPTPTFQNFDLGNFDGSGYADWSASMWLNPDASDDGLTMWGWSEGRTDGGFGSDCRFRMGRSSNNEAYVSMRTDAGTEVIETSTTGSFTGANGWYHLYVSFKENEYFRLYVNGAYVGEISVVGKVLWKDTSHHGEILSSGNQFPTGCWDGYIDQILFYDFAGGQTEAEYLYASGAGVETNLIQATKQ